MEIVIMLLALPLIWPFIAKVLWKREIIPLELAANVGAVAIAGVLVYYFALGTLTSDTEIINGAVTGKDKVRVSCSHSYNCNCRPDCSTNADGSKSCSEKCDTCYEHMNDWDWDVHTSAMGQTVTIDRIDRQGAREPSRWTEAKIGDPVALPHEFTNYIKGAEASLFNTSAYAGLVEKFAGKLPPYPDKVHDYHYLNRVINLSPSVPATFVNEVNQKLALALRDLGPTKQVNLIVVLTELSDPNYATALHKQWLGGKKNDVVVVVGVTHYPAIGWARILSWSDTEMLKVSLRDSIQELEGLSADKFVDTIITHTKTHFIRKKMADFEYLKGEISLSMGILALIEVGLLLFSVALSLYFAKNRHR